MLDDALARCEQPVAQPATLAELVDVAGLPVVNEVLLPPNSVYWSWTCRPADVTTPESLVILWRGPRSLRMS